MKQKILMLITFLLIGVGTALGQTITAKGRVVDENGDGAISATVRLKSDAKKGTFTDMDGNFSLEAKQGEMIIISYVGYKEVEVAAKAAMGTIKLTPDSEVLDDVVVVAYGTVKKQSLVGAQASVSAKQIEKRPITNVSNALAAAAPGVQTITSSGQPGSSTSIRIRGFGSANASSAPLFVVDGSVYNGNISDIATQDIQSVSILKDAASTALYGSSAGNGVILITTKNGSRADKGKPSFTFTTNVGGSVKGAANYETVNAMQYAPLLWQQWFNEYKYTKGMPTELAAQWANYYLMDDMKYQPYAGVKTYLKYDKDHFVTTNDAASADAPLLVMPNGTLNPEITGLLWADDTNWEKAFFRTGLRQEYVLSGGLNTEKMRSFISLGYLSEEGYKKYTSMNRFSARANLSYDITKWLTVGSNISITKGHSESPKVSGSAASNPFSWANRIAPIYPIYRHNADGSFVLDGNGAKVFDYSLGRPYADRFNPAYEQMIDKSYSDRDAITTRTTAAVKLYDGLTFRTNLGYDLLNYKSKSRYNNIMGNQPQGNLKIGNSRYTTVTFNQILEYDKIWGDHHLNTILGHEAYMYMKESFSAEKEKMAILGMDEMSNLANMSDISSSSSNYRKEGYFGRINYDYSDRYNVSLSYRYDGSSVFAPNKRWGHFWSIGAGWNIANEKFMTSTKDWLDILKLRASIGQTGNDAISTYYAYQTLFGFGSNNYDDIGFRVSNLGNMDLIWEKQTAYDLALEFSIFRKLRGTIEFFNKESDDLLFEFPLPASTGVGSMDMNLGKIRNYGLEFDLNYNILRTNDWDWSVSLNGTAYKNLIVRLPEENREQGIEKGTKKWMEGKSMYDFYLNEFIGVDPDDGLAIYRLDPEQAGDLADPKNPDFIGMAKEGDKATWTKNGKYVKKHYAGSVIPDLYGGFSTELSYKNLDFSVLFAYQLGGKVYDSAYQDLMGRRLSAGRTFHVDMLNAWKQPGDTSNIPRLDSTSTNYDNLTSDRYLISGSSLMLKNISLGYTLPKSFVNKLDLKSARIGISAENLFLWSKRKGLNPMSGYSGISSNTSYDYAKVFSASLSISF